MLVENVLVAVTVGAEGYRVVQVRFRNLYSSQKDRSEFAVYTHLVRLYRQAAINRMSETADK